MANIGYYDMSLGQGSTFQVAPILTAGNSADLITVPNASQLADVDILFVNNSSNSDYGAEYLANLASIEQRVSDGMVLVIHDRFVSDAETILPGGATLNIVRDFADAANIEIVDDDHPIAIGPGGTITDASLDGGNWSSHGYVLASSLPPGSDVFLTTSDPTHVVAFGYRYGDGYVVYSTIPLDFYLAGQGNDLLDKAMAIYAANLLNFLESPIEPTNPPTDISLTGTVVNEFAVNGTVVGTLSATDPDLPNETFTYTLLDDWGGRLAIGGVNNSQIIVADSVLIDFEQGASFDIIVRVRDSNFNSFDKTFTINVNNVDPENITGDSRDNVLVGGLLDDSFAGDAGNDKISGNGGNDTIFGNNGNDLLQGGENDDRLSGSIGNDTLSGDDGADILTGGNGDDRLIGGAGDDLLIGGTDLGADVLLGGAGLDVASYFSMTAAVIIDLVQPTNTGGAAAGDTFFGIENFVLGSGNDSFMGNAVRNDVRGKDGADTLDGGGGSDILSGGAGSDVISGGVGNDRVSGGLGTDSFVFSDGWGNDRVIDFELGVDIIDLTGVTGAAGLADLTILDAGGGAEVRFGSNAVLLVGVSAISLTAADFDFAP